MHQGSYEVPNGNSRRWDYTSMPDGWVGYDNMTNTFAETEAGGWVKDVPSANQAMGNNSANGDNNATTSASQPESSSGGACQSSAAAGSGVADVTLVHDFLHKAGIPGETVDEPSWAVLRVR